MRNHEVTNVQLLLDEKGELREPGWSRRMVQQYRRSMIKAPSWRIKEWDYYLVVNREFAAAFTVSDDGYIGLQSVSLLTFGDVPWEHTETVLNPFPMGIQTRDFRWYLKPLRESGKSTAALTDSAMANRWKLTYCWSSRIWIRW